MVKTKTNKKRTKTKKTSNRGPGQPPKYTTVEELQEKIDQYFEYGFATHTVTTGKGEKQKTSKRKIYTITGLILFLGFCDRQSFYDMEKRPEFSCTIKRARTRLECHYESLLQISSNAGGPIFALKNFGWKDKVEQSVGVSDDLKKLMSEISAHGNGLPIKS